MIVAGARLRPLKASSSSADHSADEEVTNDLNIGSTDIDMTNMKTTVGSGNSRRSGQPMDMNMYATRKTIAQGIMDLGLMCANASQLKYVLINANQHRYFQVTVSLIVMSIIFQVIVGIMFIALGRLNINFVQDRRKADMMNNASVILIFLVTVVNVLITAFGPSESYGTQYNGSQGNKLTSWTNYYQGNEATNSLN